MELTINIFDRIIMLLMFQCVLQVATTIAIVIGFMTLKDNRAR